MILSTVYRCIELFVLFILLPISFLFDYPILFKIILTLVGFAYILLILKRQRLLKFGLGRNKDWNSFWKEMVIKLSVVIIVTAIYVFFTAPDKLFIVVLKDMKMWISILFVYSLLSVWPQEIVYRTFFYERYQILITNPWLFAFINGILFSLAHLFLKSFLVQILTFIGGIAFALTYQRTKSTTMVSIEHALYGNWLFTVGMGEMLAFPMPS